VSGSRTFQGVVYPLFVIDSTPGDPGMLHPSQVASVTVLKGASAAIYGRWGFGGCSDIHHQNSLNTKNIVITTKRIVN